MEFPELGSHCSEASCKRLDFLPIECDACHRIFCKDHHTYDQHNCTEAHDKNVVVPTCPLCNQPVPVTRGEDPNIKVNNHIQQECRSEKAKKLYTNRCSFPGCKKKELVPVTCNTCRQNFCLKHRFETNHNCQGHQRSNRPGGSSRSSARSQPSGSVRSKPSTSRAPQSTTLTQIGAELHRERIQRQQQRQAPRNTSSQANSGISEDEALRQAIAASLTEQPSSQSTAVTQQPQSQSQPNCEEDEALARAIAASLNEAPPKPRQPPQRQSSRGGLDCQIS